MQIDLIVIGNLKEKALVALCDEYVKRLRPYCKLTIYELKDESTKLEKSVVLKKEKEKILSKLDLNSYLMILDIDGQNISSEQFAQKVESIVTYENSKITFLIGGSYGIDEEIKKMAKFKLSFSKMTFPHQLFRIMFLEQLYRQFKISKNEPYHK